MVGIRREGDLMRIVVGASAHAGSHPAIAWALEFAHKRTSTIELVHVVDTTWGRAQQGYIDEALLVAEEKLRDLARSAQQSYPSLVVQSHVRAGAPVNELVAAAEGADYLVIGAHPDEHHAGASRRAVRLARLAPCSVIVAPSDVIPRGSGVVVGVDGSVESDLAVEFAAALADRHGEELSVLLAWGHPEAWGMVEPILVDGEPTEEDRLVVAESIAGLPELYPDLIVRTEISAARPERALYAASLGARMLVVGSHGHHGVERALLGSTSEAMVADLPCAVAVIRGPAPA